MKRSEHEPVYEDSFFEHPRVVKRNFQEVVEIPAPVSHRRGVWYDRARSLGSAPNIVTTGRISWPTTC